jgi:hypothetical protein
MSMIKRAFWMAALAGLIVLKPTATHADSVKVTICHIPPGNPANAHSITVGIAAVPAHLVLHGDSLGACGGGGGGS